LNGGVVISFLRRFLFQWLGYYNQMTRYGTYSMYSSLTGYDSVSTGKMMLMEP